ncbi:hypothetical protein [Paenibacillus sp. 1P07SE]|uniref:hypothetical protein n=1 Tax=Paenibacillus sp. 1P07SE TaxID=3132209 RepID=UPI0039A6DDF1
MGICVFELKEHLQHHKYAWPLSPVRYPVEFAAEEAHLDSFRLQDDAGQPVPVQIAASKLQDDFVLRGEVCFLTDLPQGGTRRYELHYGPDPVESERSEAHVDSGMITRREGAGLVFGNGLIEVSFPGSGGRLAPCYEGAKPEELELFRIGCPEEGELAVARLAGRGRVSEIQSESLADGPVLHEQRITVVWEDGGWYALKVRLTTAMPYLELEEEMKVSAGGRLEIAWPGLAPARRYTRSRGEEAVDAYLGEQGELPFRLLPYDSAHSWHRGRSAAFIDEEKGRAAGLFHGDPLRWDDGEYALWRSSDTLAISFRLGSGASETKGAAGVEGGGRADQPELLSWHYPLASGTRSTKIAVYPADRQLAAEATAAFQRPAAGSELPLIDELALWHCFLALDKVKDWVLDWEEPQESYPRLFEPEQLPKSMHLWYFDLHGPPVPEDMEEIVDKLSFNFNQVEGTAPVASREFAYWTPIFDLTARAMTPEQFRRLKAASAFMAYVREDEYVAPIQTMLAGHPNFLADYKMVPAYMSALFPNHPHAGRWRAHFEKSMALNLKYHTRPDVPAWDAVGGRWTENLGCYVWAMLVPTVRAAWCLHRTYGDHTLLYPNLAKLAGWLLNSLSAPLPQGRSYPQQGAHSGVHQDPQLPPYALRLVGEMLMRYEPLLAERLLAVCPVDAAGFESRKPGDIWRLMLTGETATNTGTPPQLRSAKYTGYGFVLRSGVGTGGEMSVHLQQIDEGPNYRWGRSGDGGNGVVYYYADGKRYSYNRAEDVGDDNMGTGEGSSTFAVLDGHEYKSIGRSELTGPLHDFGFAQYALLEAGPAAKPHYRSRSLLMSGNDYIVLYDEVADMRVRGRFSWFTHRDDPAPAIYQLKPGVPASPVQLAGPVDGPQLPPGTYKLNRPARGYPDGVTGRYYDGFGDFLTVVTHRGSWQPQILSVEATSYGARVTMAGRIDEVFRSATRIRHNDGVLAFDGYAGIVRRFDEQQVEAALFKGRSLAAAGIRATIAADGGHRDGDEPAWTTNGTGAEAGTVASSATGGSTGKQGGSTSMKAGGGVGEVGAFAFATTGGELRGQSSSAMPMRIRLELPASWGSEAHRLYIDGAASETVAWRCDGGQAELIFTLPAGSTVWQWTAGDAAPGEPGALRISLAAPDAAELVWDAAAGADGYEVAVSRDGCRSWRTAERGIGETRYRLQGLVPGTKLHVRLRPWRGETAGEWSEPYPVYPSEQAPPAPDGLRLRREDGAVEASWGMVLGAQRYRLYRRRTDRDEHELVYEGEARSYRDEDAAAAGQTRHAGHARDAVTVPEGDSSGMARLTADAGTREARRWDYAYSVSAVNGNGEGPRSLERDTAPGGLIDWDPMPHEKFRRYTRSHEYGHNGFPYWTNEQLGSLPEYPS